MDQNMSAGVQPLTELDETLEQCVIVPSLCKVCKIGWTTVDSHERIKIPFCIHIKVLNTEGKTNKPKRESKRDEILKLVSAVRNSGGGDLIVHFQELQAEYRNLCYFHEIFDDHLNSLIEDGKSFSDVYKKTWFLDKFDKGDSLSEYLILRVAPSNAITTADFKTKIALDFSIIRPSALNMKYTLFAEKRSQTTVKHKSCFNEDIEESRCIQFKSVSSDFIQMDHDRKAHYIWVNLRLREYITSFSKLDEGGSFFIGIGEKITKDSAGCRKVEVTKDGIPLPPTEQTKFEECIKQKITDSLRFTQKPEELQTPLVTFYYYPRSGDNSVVEIAVQSVQGCVFYDAQGPETYFSENDGKTFTRVPFSKWLDKLKNLTL